MNFPLPFIWNLWGLRYIVPTLTPAGELLKLQPNGISTQCENKTRVWMCRDVIFLQVWVNAPVWKWHGEKSVVSLGCFKKQKGPKSLCRKQSTETRLCLLFFFLCLLICVVYIVIIDVSYEYTYFIFNCLKCSEKSCSTLSCNFFLNSSNGTALLPGHVITQ